MKIRKAVFPVAGLGTRVLPATKAMPKEMLTIVDQPLIQYVVDEAQEAGIEHFIFVTGRNKGVIEDHFDRMFELDTTLDARGNKKAEMEILARDQPEAGATEFHAPAGAARPWSRGVVRPRHRRRRAVRGGAAGRTGAEHSGLPEADDRGRQQARRKSNLLAVEEVPDESHPSIRHLRRRQAPRARTCSRSTAWWRSRRRAPRRRICRSPGATSCSRKSSRSWKPRSAALAARSSSPTR